MDYEDTIKITNQSKGIRLDIYVEDEENTVYNLEMQAENTGVIPKRSRYYQSIIDLNILEKGENYDKLKMSIVVFLCTFDLFEQNQYIYTFENQCIEVEGLRLKDGTKKIFLNTKGTKGNISHELKDLLSYMDGKEPQDSLAKNINNKVLEAKNNIQWRREYMSMYADMRDNYLKGERKGFDRGNDEMNELIIRLTEMGRNEDIVKAAKDEEYKNKLKKELGIGE